MSWQGREVLLQLALSIDTRHDRDEMLRRTLRLFIQRLGCLGAGVATRSGERWEMLFSIPRRIPLSDSLSVAIMAAVSDGQAGFRDAQGRMGQTWNLGEGRCLFVLWSAEVGFALVKDLQPVVAKLAEALTYIEQRQHSRELADISLHLSRIIARSPMVAITWRNEPHWPVEFVSENIWRFGYRTEDFLDGRIRYTDLIHPDDRTPILEELQNHLDHGSCEFLQEYRLRHGNGRWIWVEDYTWLLRENGSEFKTMHGALVDVTQRRQAREQADFLTHHDQLTGLPNRILGKIRLDQEVARADRQGTRLTVLHIDLDWFRHINDVYGHSRGDLLLQGIAKRLAGEVRSSEHLCRLSADEFMLVVPDTGDGVVAGFAGFCERLLGLLNAPFDLDGQMVKASFSIGAARFPQDGRDAETLMRNADTALREAKRAGRQTYCYFRAELNDELSHFVETREVLRTALEREEFVLYYQPQIDLRTGHVVGLEALIRWNRPDGLMMPGQFIHVAEESGLIVPIGRWVLLEACRQAARWRRSGWPDLVMAVNLSTVQFRQGQIRSDVTEALERAELDPSGLDLELTESILLQDEQAILATVAEWRQQGIRVSIDDFGTGYSSLSYLRRFQVDKIKIDRSFIANFSRDPGDHAIVSAILQLARGLNLLTVAEGVEESGLAEQLAAVGCDHAQGYLYAKPLPATELEAWLEQRRT